jgi:hypothetical protein
VAVLAIGGIDSRQIHRVDGIDHEPRQMAFPQRGEVLGAQRASHYLTSGGIKNTHSRSHAKKFCAIPKGLNPPGRHHTLARQPRVKGRVSTAPLGPPAADEDQAAYGSARSAPASLPQPRKGSSAVAAFEFPYN